MLGMLLGIIVIKFLRCLFLGHDFEEIPGLNIGKLFCMRENIQFIGQYGKTFKCKCCKKFKCIPPKGYYKKMDVE
jgi:hypothetical protein